MEMENRIVDCVNTKKDMEYEIADQAKIEQKRK